MPRDFHQPGRSLAVGDQGMVATSHPQATLAGLEILKSGGNAVDAAIAAAAVQTAVDPAMTGIAGDAFVLFAPANRAGTANPVIALNGNGKAPAATDAAALRAQGLSEIPQTSPHAVTVPCGVATWFALQERFGTKSMAEILAPAIAQAAGGFRITPRVAADFAANSGILAANSAASANYLPGGRVPGLGDRLQLPHLAQTLRVLAKDGAKAFYEGALAEAMVASLRAAGGCHTLDDFAGAQCFESAPIASTYRDLTLTQCPPSGQGIIALLLLNILEGCELRDLDPNGPERLHLEAEATKLAFLERQTHLADPDFANVPIEQLLSKEFAAGLRAKIDPNVAAIPTASAINGHEDTIYLTVVDRDLNAVSFIQSLYSSFGTGIACPETGVLFHCRGRGFTLEAGHKNELAAGKRPMHTIIPGMALKDGKAAISYGVMGADYQPVGHAHVISNIVDYGMDVQAALDAPRVMAYPHDLEIEATLPESTRRKLAAMGHDVVVPDMPMGSGQAIMIDYERGVLLGGGDHRKDSVAMGL